MVAVKSRAEYFRERRKNVRIFYANVPIEKMLLLERGLLLEGKTKTQWLIEKIDSDFGIKK